MNNWLLRENALRGVLFFLAVVLLGVAAWAQYPPITVEINAEHPLLIFQCAAESAALPEQYAERIMQSWRAMPDAVRPYAVMQADAPRGDRHAYYQAMLPALQEANLPVVLRIAGDDPRRRCAVSQVEALLRAFTVIKGVEATDLPLNVYDPLAVDEEGISLPARWLTGILETAARYGRFLHLPLGEVAWLRLMANPDYARVLAKMRECQSYVIPSCLHRGPGTVAQTAAVMGLWLEGCAAQWGIAADSRWYADARFIAPNLFGAPADPTKVPSALYRAMILNGALAGAAVYAFSPDDDLWFGAQRRHWDAAILPTMMELIARGLIARKDFVEKKTQVAYQLGAAATPGDFHRNLRDLDATLDEGLLIHAAYGVERPGQITELVLNRGDLYRIPVFSPYAPQEALGGFALLVQPGAADSVQGWAHLLEAYRSPDGAGDAFISVVGRGIFIMHTRENTLAAQRFALNAAPAPVRRFTARCEGENVELTWPFREGDVSYTVLRRIPPDPQYLVLAEGVLERRYVDPFPPFDQTLAYAVTALTNETEPFEGVLHYGEHLLLSVVESRIAEEAILSPLLTAVQSAPIPETPAPPEEASPWWPDYDGLDETQQATARAIVERIELWERAFQAGDLDGVMDLYATDYEDAQGWGFQYVRRAYQWFFERCRTPRIHRQIRRWNFQSYATTREVNLLLYCALTGVAWSDPAGRIADQIMAIPRTESAEAWFTFTDKDGVWRIQRTNPAVPNFRDLLSYAAGPYDDITPGPDQLARP